MTKENLNIRIDIKSDGIEHVIEENKCYMIFLNGKFHDRYGYVSLKTLKGMMKDLSIASKNQPVSAFEYNPNKVISHMEYHK